MLIRAVNWGAYTVTFSDGTTAFKWNGFSLPQMTTGQDAYVLEITATEVVARMIGRDIRNV